MITKQKPARTSQMVYGNIEVYQGGSSSYSAQVTSGSDTITYGEGSRLPGGHWPWKPCRHTTGLGWLSPSAGTLIQQMKRHSDRRWYLNARTDCVFGNRYRPIVGTLPSTQFDDTAFSGILNQIDLNKGESVLLYSGILQAVPLVGSALKLSSILNRAARNLSKSFRKKPFTTVVKSLISADFVDRFVISPTIDDARRFMDATNYVLNVLATARERTAHRFALQSEVKTVDERESGTWGPFAPNQAASFDGVFVRRRRATSKAFALLEAEYRLDASTPIQVWARRTGLTRPLDSVWDLVPFSFVIDYFTRAGDFISALSDEMSDVQGLKGRITRIHDVWAVTTAETIWEGQATIARGFREDWDDHNVLFQFEPNTAVFGQKYFDRQQIANPWQRLLPLQERISDYLQVSLVPSSRQARTIAELIIQAKL